MSEEPPSPTLRDRAQAAEFARYGEFGRLSNSPSEAGDESDPGDAGDNVALPVIPCDATEWATAFGQAEPRDEVVSEWFLTFTSCAHTHQYAAHSRPGHNAFQIAVGNW